MTTRARRTVSRGGFRADSPLDGTAPPAGGTEGGNVADAPKRDVFWRRRVLLDHSLALWHPSGSRLSAAAVRQVAEHMAKALAERAGEEKSGTSGAAASGSGGGGASGDATSWKPSLTECT